MLWNRPVTSFDANLDLILHGDQWRFSTGEQGDGHFGDCNAIWKKRRSSREEDEEETRIGHGWNKEVFRRKGDLRVIKTVNGSPGSALHNCLLLSETQSATYSDCFEMATNKFLKEISVLIRLQGDANVPRLHGYCIPLNWSTSTNISLLAMETEYGRALDMVNLVQIEWERRLELLRQIIDFVHRIWPLSLQDLRRQQFVVGENGRALYIDYDDVVLLNDNDNDNDNGNCHGYGRRDPTRCNEQRQTAERLYEAFVQDLLWYGNPAETTSTIDSLRQLHLNHSLSMSDLCSYTTMLSEKVQFS